MTDTIWTLSPDALETLRRLADTLWLHQFSQASAAELAERGYAVRRTNMLTITDKGILAARAYFVR